MNKYLITVVIILVVIWSYQLLSHMRQKEVTGLGEPLLSGAGEENKEQKPTPLLLGAGGQPVLIHWTLWILMIAFLKVGDVHCWRQPRSFCIGPDKCFQLPCKFIYLFSVYWLGTGPQVNITSPCPIQFSKCYCLAQGSGFSGKEQIFGFVVLFNSALVVWKQP